jgi:hypothetical protein
VFSLKSDICMLLLLMVVCGAFCRLITAPKDAWADCRRFFRWSDIRVGMQNPVTAAMIVGGSLLFVSTVLWIVGWLTGIAVITALGYYSWPLIFVPLLMFLGAVLCVSVLQEAFRPLRRKTPTLADRVRSRSIPRFVQRRKDEAPEFLKPGGRYQVVNIRRYGNLP